MNDTAALEALTAMSGSLGRIEVEVKRIAGMEERLRHLELDMSEIKATRKPRTPWYTWLGGVGVLLALVLQTFSLINIVEKIATVLP